MIAVKVETNEVEANDEPPLIGLRRPKCKRPIIALQAPHDRLACKRLVLRGVLHVSARRNPPHTPGL